MKKFLRVVLISFFALVSFAGFNTITAKADIQMPTYLHTLYQSNLYSRNDNGEYTLISNRGLSDNTDWLTDSFDPTNNYWRVGANEWVENYKVAQVFENYHRVITNDSNTKIYSMDSDYRFIETGSTLNAGSWMNDKEVAIPSAVGAYAPAVYYRVATNEWIRLN